MEKEEFYTKDLKQRNSRITFQKSGQYVWETPQEFFDKLNEEFHFDIDVCADEENHKCILYYTEEQDGLKQEWKGTCWMNPPYGTKISKWVKKAFESSGGGQQLFAYFLQEQIQDGGGIIA